MFRFRYGDLGWDFWEYMYIFLSKYIFRFNILYYVLASFGEF